MKSIFDGVSRNNEDSTSELLKNLMNVTYIRNLICSFLGINEEICKTIKSDDINTQVSFEEIGRPDLLIETTNGVIFIENKIHEETQLQSTQTTTYLEKINNYSQPYKKMIYLIPKEYNHKKELEDIVKQYKICSIKEWDSLLSFLYAQEIDKWNSIAEESLKHLSNLILKKDVILKLTREELIMMLDPKEIAIANSFFIKAGEFIKGSVSELIKKLGTDFTPSDFNWGNKEYEMGKYINYINKQQTLFIGFNLALIREHPDKEDFCFALDIKKDIINIDNIKNLTDKEIYFDEEWYYFKLDKYNYTNFENINKFVEELEDLIKKYV